MVSVLYFNGVADPSVSAYNCPMEDLPTFGEFKSLLRDDPLFCDYFNAFLNLPVSS